MIDPRDEQRPGRPVVAALAVIIFVGVVTAGAIYVLVRVLT